MSGDYSRRTFRPRNHYAGVLMQQGRVQLDADWNEQVEILDRRNRAEAIDVIGRCGVPAETPDGFRIDVDGETLTIGRGRIYVDGNLAENHGRPPSAADDAPGADPAQAFDRTLVEMHGSEPLPFGEQPYMPDPPPLPGIGRHLVYLDVWQREVTALERPDLVEVAVGVDTTTRLQTVWQVRILPDVDASVTCETPDADLAAYLDATRPSAGRLSASAGTDAEDDDPCLVPAEGGYRGLENHLYRVEIHDPGPPEVATFKWSRENRSVGSSVTAIADDRERLTLESLGRDKVLRIDNGAWIEVLDDHLELAGERGHVAEVIDADEASGIITIAPAIPASFDLDATLPERRTRVRRWDQEEVFDDTEDDPTSDGVIQVPPSGTVVVLERGVQVEFDTEPADGAFRTGDYWVFAARHADASVEPLRRAPPLGVHHHYCRLALLTVTGQPGALQLQVQDCRPSFPSLTGICADDVCFDDERCHLGAETVQQALEVLCTRDAGPGGRGHCTVTLGVDGIHDLQVAVDRLPPEGGCICVPGREFRQTQTVMVSGRQAIAIAGCGPASVIRFDAGGGPLFAIQGSSDIVLRDLNLVNDRGSGVQVVESSLVRVLDCSLACPEGAAVELVGAVRHLTVDGCSIAAATGVSLPEFDIDGLQVLRNRFDVTNAALEGGEGSSLINVRVFDNVVQSDDLLAVFLFLAMLPSSGNVSVRRNRISLPMVQDGRPAVQVRTMEPGSLLTLSENLIGTPEAPVSHGVLVESMMEDAELVLDANHVTSVGEALQAVPGGTVGRVRANANVLRSVEARVVVTIGQRPLLNARANHALFSNNQVSSRQVPTISECTVNLSALHLVVVGNYVEDAGQSIEDEDQPRRPGVSICLTSESEAATAIGNVTHSGINLEGSVSSNVVVTHNARV
jgi:hypothetical protein